MNGLFMIEIKAAMADTMMEMCRTNIADSKSIGIAFASLTDKLEQLMNADFDNPNPECYHITASPDDPEVKPFIDELFGKKG